MTQKDYYQILGVEPSSAAKAIKEAYRKLAFQYHPDRNQGNPDAAEKMKSVNEAYAVLSNPSKRLEYDGLRQQFGASAYHRFRQSHSDQDIFSGSDIGQILEEMAKSFGFRSFDDIFREFYGQGQGTAFEFKTPGLFGRGFIFSGYSDNGKDQPLPRSAGFLTKLFRLALETVSGVKLPENGADIRDTIVLSPEHAREGGPYAYYHKKKAGKLVVKIPPGTRQDQHIRLAGMGADGKNGGKPGDLYLKVRIKKSLLGKLQDIF